MKTGFCWPHSGATGGSLVLIEKAKNERQCFAVPSTALQDEGMLRPGSFLQKEQEE